MSVSKSKVYEWVGDILAARKADRNNLVYRLHLLGWTQQEISNICGCAQSTISQNILSQIPDMEKMIIQTVDEMKEPMSKAAEKLYIDETLAWALYLILCVVSYPFRTNNIQ